MQTEHPPEFLDVVLGNFYGFLVILQSPLRWFVQRIRVWNGRWGDKLFVPCFRTLFRAFLAGLFWRKHTETMMEAMGALLGRSWPCCLQIQTSTARGKMYVSTLSTVESKKEMNDGWPHKTGRAIGWWGMWLCLRIQCYYVLLDGGTREQQVILP